MTNQRKQLYIILSDYSDDLGALKKRDGRFPADAAVERILVLTKPSQAGHSSEWQKEIEQCFIKNNMCDCGEKHTKLSLDDTEYFDVEAVVKDIQILFQAELSKAEKRGGLKEKPRKWWVTDKDGPTDNYRVAGPFTTNADAGIAREIIERHSKRTYWIKQLESDLSIGGEK